MGRGLQHKEHHNYIIKRLEVSDGLDCWTTWFTSLQLVLNSPKKHHGLTKLRLLCLITLSVAYVLVLKNLQAGYVMMLRVTYFPKQFDWYGNMPISIINSMVSSAIWD